MKCVSDLVPNLVKGDRIVPLVIDDEVSLFQAIGKYLPNVKRVLCWNHIVNAIKTWLKKHGSTASEIPVYTSYVRELLCQQSLVAYNEKLESFRKN